MAFPLKQVYTIDDNYALPEGERAELIDGRMVLMAPPGTLHQRISHLLEWRIEDYIRRKKGDCQVFAAPFAVFLNADEKTYVEPDISVVCDRDKLDERGCNGAPDFIIEIVSAGSRRTDYGKKNSLYADSGVREYWIVDPEKQSTTVYRYEEDAAPMIFPFDQTVTAGIYGDLNITITELLS